MTTAFGAAGLRASESVHPRPPSYNEPNHHSIFGSKPVQGGQGMAGSVPHCVPALPSSPRRRRGQGWEPEQREPAKLSVKHRGIITPEVGQSPSTADLSAGMCISTLRSIPSTRHPAPAAACSSLSPGRRGQHRRARMKSPVRAGAGAEVSGRWPSPRSPSPRSRHSLSTRQLQDPGTPKKPSPINVGQRKSERKPQPSLVAGARAGLGMT